MSFDKELYEGIFCYALIHLLNKKDRNKLINDCYSQLRPYGYMVFTAKSKNSATYGEGIELVKDRFETNHGVNLFYYDSEPVDKEFDNYGSDETKETLQKNFSK